MDILWMLGFSYKEKNSKMFGYWYTGKSIFFFEYDLHIVIKAFTSNSMLNTCIYLISLDCIPLLAWISYTDYHYVINKIEHECHVSFY